MLAAISILSVVILLAGSIHIFGQRQFIAQSESAAQANDMSHALTVMTTDLRKLDSEKVTVENENKIIVDNVAIYSVENRQLKKGDIVLAEEVTAQFIKDENENSIRIIIENIVESGLKKKYETTIYFRR